MAEKKADQKLTVEDRLKALYKLQTILTEIDGIRLKRGELPLEVRDLEDAIEGLNTRIENYKQDIETLRRRTVEEREKITQAQSLIERYGKQLEGVRNNREFDDLSKEIEYQKLEIELSEKHINEYGRQIESKQAEIGETESALEDRNHVLAEKKAELEQIVSETKQQEDQLREEAKAIEKTFVDADGRTDRILNAFKRIRKNARNGLGIASIQRNACGGCFNRIPPQKQMEIKMHKKTIVCEYCGRIMIDPELAGIEETPETSAKK